MGNVKSVRIPECTMTTAPMSESRGARGTSLPFLGTPGGVGPAINRLESAQI